MAAQACRRRRRDSLQRAPVRAHRGGVRVADRIESRTRPDSAGHPRVRAFRTAGRKTQTGREGAPVQHQPATRGPLCRVPREGAGRRKHLDRHRARVGFGRTSSVGCRGRKDGRQRARPFRVGDRQHEIERRSVSDVLNRAAPSRTDLEEVQEPRRQRRRQ